MNTLVRLFLWFVLIYIIGILILAPIVSLLLAVDALADEPDEVRVGAFLHGWNTDPAPGLYYQETFILTCAQDDYVVPHRLSQMYGNQPFFYIGPSGNTIQETIDGTLDDCWSKRFEEIPEHATIAPMQEQGGWWVDWYSPDPADFINAFAHIQTLTDKEFLWCWAPNHGDTWRKYQPAEYDLLCPSIFDMSGRQSGTKIAQIAGEMGRAVAKPVIIAQTATARVNPFDANPMLLPEDAAWVRTTQETKVQWLNDLVAESNRQRIISDVIYFNHNESETRMFAFPEGFPYG